MMETFATTKVSIVLRLFYNTMETRERILQKAHELFNRYGIRSVTMDEIASQVGMSKKTIYQSFANKDELVDAVVQDHIEHNKCHCDNVESIAENAVHEIFLTLDMLQEMLGNVNATIYNDLQRFHPNSFEKLQKFKEAYLYQKIYNNVAWGVREGLYRSDLDLDVVTRLRLATLFLPFNQELFPITRYSLVQVELVAIDLFLYGLATSKAHRLIEKYKLERIKTNK